MNRSLILAALLAATTLAPACTGSKTRATTPMNTYENADKEGLPREVWVDRVDTGETLAKKAHVASVYETRHGDLMKIQVNLQNDSGRSIFVRYRVEWFDDEGFKVDSPTESWNNVQISKGQRLALPAIATSPRAVNWRISIQESAM